MVVTPIDALTDVGATWEDWGGIWGGEFRDPVHFEFPGFKQRSQLPPEGGLFAKLVDTLSGFVPFLGEAQIADSVFRLTGGDPNIVEFYLQHPAEAIRDLVGGT